MTLLLASVADVREAELAVAGGADIVDFNDPMRGAIGTVPPPIVRDGHAAVDGRCRTSAAIDGAPLEPAELASTAAYMVAIGVDYVRIGLAASPRREACIAALGDLARRARLLGVLRAHEGVDFAVLDRLVEAGFAGAMIETTHGDGGGHCDFAAVSLFVEGCRQRRLLSGIAGSLEAPDIPRLLPIEPDILGFAGALRAPPAHGSAVAPLTFDVEALALLRVLIPPDRRGQATGGPRDSSPAARPGGGGASCDSMPLDRVFVHDLVVPMSIGAYRRERGAGQRVRFNVDAFVRPIARVASDMRDILSYDVISDAVHRVSETHVDLVETVAERVATALLAQPRVVTVTVRVEKLDVSEAAVGVEITRKRREAPDEAGAARTSAD